MGLTWEKSVCRFCGVGCGVVVGTRDDQVIAVKGDPENPVNRGLLCAKGYANANIMYGADRLHQPLLRMKNGRFDKAGEFTPVSWERAFDEMEASVQAGPRRARSHRGRDHGLRSVHHPRGLRRGEAHEGRLADRTTSTPTPATAWPRRWPVSCRSSASTNPPAAMTTSSSPTPSSPGAPTWPRCTPCCGRGWSSAGWRTRRRSIVNLTTSPKPDLRRRRHRDHLQAPDRSRDLELHRPRDRHPRCRRHDFVDRHCVFATGPTDIGYGMRATDDFAYPAERDIQERERVVVLTRDEAIAQGLDPDRTHTVEQRRPQARQPTG